MRENAWHLRLPTPQDEQWFRNLVSLHELTATWLKEVQTERPTHLLTRGLSQEVSENLWILDSLSETRIEDLLDDTSPKEMLARLEQTIWAVQAWTLVHFYEKSKTENRSALDTLLEQISWKLGRNCAEGRWQKWSQRENPDLRDVLLALNDSPFSGYPSASGFLVKRALPEEVQVDLRFCPHQSQYPEIKPVADSLCRLHGYWIKGFAYALNNRISVEPSTQLQRCGLKWFYA